MTICIDSCAAQETIVVTTRSNIYELVVLRGDRGDVFVRGGKHFTDVTQVQLLGSIADDGTLEPHTIGIGRRMTFVFGERFVVTSPVQSLSHDNGSTTSHASALQVSESPCDIEVDTRHVITTRNHMRAVNRSVLRSVVATMLALVASPVLAQAPEEASTRASLLDTARDTLATQSVPPQRSVVERGLSWYDNQYLFAKLFSRWNGVHLAGGGFPAGAGLSFGFGYEKALTAADPDPLIRNRVDLTAGAAYSTRNYVRVSAGVKASNLGGSRVDVGVSSQYFEFPQEDFFGPGMNSLESNRTNYLLEAMETGVSLRWKPSKLEVGGGVAYFNPRVGRGTDSRFLSTDALFTATAAPGLGTNTDFLKTDLSVAFDWRDNPALPRTGGRYAIAFTTFDDRDHGQYDFSRVDVSLQQYVPLPDRYRIVALRVQGAFTNADSDQSIPFYLQPTLGGASHLRGFRESRFRDQNSLLVGAEYQWEAWWALDPALFVDAGMVAPSRRNLSLRETEIGYGVGFRFHSNRAFVGRLDLAFSREGFVPLLRFEHVF